MLMGGGEEGGGNVKEWCQGKSLTAPPVIFVQSLKEVRELAIR